MQFIFSNAWLHALGIPGRADLDATVGRIDVHVGRHARDLAVGVDHRERQHRACREQAEPAIDFLAHAFRRWNGGVPELRQIAVADGFRQPVTLVLRQRLEPRVFAAQGDRFKEGHLGLRC